MDNTSKTMIGLFLTIFCLMGLGVAEFFKLDLLMLTCFIGGIISGICTLIKVFEKKEEDDDEDEE